MYAIIESCGKQYKVTEGDVVFFEKLDVEEGKKVTFDKVVLVSNDEKEFEQLLDNYMEKNKNDKEEEYE